MKKILIALMSASVLAFATGCSTQASVGNHNQHGAGASVKTEGPKRGVSGSIY